ncbi:MarR family winged helix-turn-helix transcriptional regulator [Clostridium oceanicum]|uniref:MarR family winged helix-turn-helix transcriptional regulator n=2 Tax=Clostridium oceanicum TaxID=1543 RepID=A0ABP3UJA1_9CLOT
MNINETNKNKISYSLLRVINKFSNIDKKTRYYGTDKQLFSSEIHMIKAIKENEGIHVTGLADKIGVTKGAVSQIIIKLEKKGMIKKEKSLYNQSKLTLKLTDKGHIAYENHEKLHNKFDSLINKILQDASTENILFIKEFLINTEDILENFEEEIK